MSLNWGSWVQTVVNFLIVAFCIFVMIRFMQNMRKKKVEEEAAAVAGPTKEEELLTEIRDILRKDSEK